MTFAEITSDPGSFADDFSNISAYGATAPEYDPIIEAAEEDRLRAWCLALGITEDELDAADQTGVGVKGIANDLVHQGYNFHG